MDLKNGVSQIFGDLTRIIKNQAFYHLRCLDRWLTNQVRSEVSSWGPTPWRVSPWLRSFSIP